MVWLSNFPNTRFPLSILRLYSMCLFLNKQWRNIHPPNVATQQNEKSIAFPQCIAHNYKKKKHYLKQICFVLQQLVGIKDKLVCI